MKIRAKRLGVQKKDSFFIKTIMFFFSNNKTYWTSTYISKPSVLWLPQIIISFKVKKFRYLDITNQEYRYRQRLAFLWKLFLYRSHPPENFYDIYRCWTLWVVKLYYPTSWRTAVSQVGLLVNLPTEQECDGCKNKSAWMSTFYSWHPALF